MPTVETASRSRTIISRLCSARPDGRDGPRSYRNAVRILCTLYRFEPNEVHHVIRIHPISHGQITSDLAVCVAASTEAVCGKRPDT